MNNKALGEFICQLRKEKGISQRELGEMLNITDKAISKWETGNSAPDISNLIPLSEIFDVSVAEILNGKRTEFNVSETNVAIVDTIQETQRKGNKNIIKAVISVIIIIAMLSASLYSFWFFYWSNRHKFLCDINSVTLTQVSEEVYEYTIEGYVHNWALNNGYSCFRFEEYCSGMPDYSYNGSSEILFIEGSKKTPLKIKGTFYASPGNTTREGVKAEFRDGVRFAGYMVFDGASRVIEGANLFMADYDIEYIFN